jgi:hypothetical protein
MRFTIALFCLLAAGTAASAQSGVTVTRDAYGNLVRRSSDPNAQRNGGQPDVHGSRAATRNSPQSFQSSGTGPSTGNVR